VFVYSRGGEPIHYHGPHKLWVIAGRPQITIDFVLKFYLYLAMGNSGFVWNSLQSFKVPAYHCASFWSDFVL